MHDDQFDLAEPLVRRLLARQFPVWSRLPISRVDSSGTVNAMFRLGDDKVVRMPFVPDGAADIGLEASWLPRLRPLLPVPIPRLLGVGTPDDDYPLPWLVLDWLPGANPVVERLERPERLASDLAAFVRALRSVPTAGGPSGYRGGTLLPLDASVRRCLAQLEELGTHLGEPRIDITALTSSWRESLAAASWHGDPVWTHGDLLPGNVLVDGGRLVGVLDFAAAGIGDPASDMMAAWSMLPASAREVFRAKADVDDPTWVRGRGWALAQAVIALPYYWRTNEGLASVARRVIAELTSTASSR
jgi:Predicted aminoglycoside phosphotransferase